MKSAMPLRRYLSLHFAIVAALPVIIIAILIWFLLLPQIRTRISVHHEGLARTVAGQISAYLQGGERQLEGLTDFVAHNDSLSAEQLTSLLDAQCGHGDFFETIYLVDRRNGVIRHVGLASGRRYRRDDLKGLDTSGFPLLSRPDHRDRPSWSQTFLSTVSSRMAVALTVPLTRRIIVGEITLDRLSEIISQLPGESGRFALVLDRQGRIVADSQRMRWGQQLDLGALQPRLPGKKAPNTPDSFELDGILFLGTMVDVKELGWKVLVAQPERAAFRPIRDTFILIVLGLGTALILALAVAWMQADGLSTLFRLYAQQAKHIARGEYELVWPTAKTIEFGMLADNLQVMAATIRRREEQLMASEERLDFALDGANEGIWDWHLDSNRIDFDARYYMISGYAPNEFPASLEEWEKRIHPADIHKTQTAVRRYLAGELSTYDVEFRFLRKDGSYMWIQGRGKIVARNDQGDPIRFIGTHADITGRKQIEESLRITQFSVDRAAVGIYRIASDARILEANEKAARMIGYTTQELTAKFIFDIDPSVTEGNWGKIWQRLLDMGSDAFTTRHKAKDGRDIPVEIYSNLLEYGEQQFSIAFVRDITERKRSEEEVRRLRNYLSNIIDSMPSVLVGVDSQGRVTQWNRQAERVTGIRSSTAHRQPLADVFPRLAPEMNRIKTSILQRRVLSDLKVPFESQEGVRYEDVTIYPLVANGVEGAVIRVDDITERVRLEEMMIQSEKMLSVGGLAAGMAHEINNPLAGMVQTATVMHNRLTNADLPANRTAAEKTGITMEAIGAFMQERGITRMLETIRQSGSRAAEIVTNMLSFARKSENVVSSENLGTLLDRVVDLLQTDYDMKKHYDFKRIELVREYDDAVAVVPCEASKIQQVFMNILKNGAEAMAEAMDTANPPIFVLRVKDDADWVRVEIEDNGPGMDEVTRRRIFEPFFTTKPLGKGTGLGLSVSYFIVTEEHGGELGVQAAENGGTRFVIRLPRGAKNAA